MDALEPDALGGRDDDAAHVVGHHATAQDLCRSTHVLDAPVGAGTNDGLVNGDVAALHDGVGVGGQVRPGDARHDLGGVDLDELLVGGVGIRVVLADGTLGAALDVLAALVVHLKEAGLAARLDGHVGNGQATLDGERLDGGATKLHGAVERAVDADLANDVQDDVLGGGTLGQLAVNLEADGLGHLEPGATGGHANAGVRGAHAGGERADAAIGAGVGVRADHEVTRHHNALLGEKGVLDAHAALFEVVGDLMLVGKVARHLGLLGALDVLVGAVVVRDQADAVAVKDARANLAHGLDGDGRRDVVGQHEVQVALHELPGNDLLEPRVVRQDLLCHSHGTCHAVSLSLSNLEALPAREGSRASTARPGKSTAGPCHPSFSPTESRSERTQ